MFDKKKPEVDQISIDEIIDDEAGSFAEVSSILAIVVLIIISAVAFLIIATAWHIPIKEIILNTLTTGKEIILEIIAVCFVGIIVYGLSNTRQSRP